METLETMLDAWDRWTDVSCLETTTAATQPPLQHLRAVRTSSAAAGLSRVAYGDAALWRDGSAGSTRELAAVAATGSARPLPQISQPHTAGPLHPHVSLQPLPRQALLLPCLPPPSATFGACARTRAPSHAHLSAAPPPPSRGSALRGAAVRIGRGGPPCEPSLDFAADYLDSGSDAEDGDGDWGAAALQATASDACQHLEGDGAEQWGDWDAGGGGGGRPHQVGGHTAPVARGPAPWRGARGGGGQATRRARREMMHARAQV